MSETADFVLSVEMRDQLGKQAAGRLRRSGHIPAVVYGGDKPPVSIVVAEEAVRELLKQKAGENTIFLLKLERTKEERRAMIKEIQVDPISGRFLHIDFIRVRSGHKLHVTMPVELVGDCVGVREGGRVDFVSRELAIEILPREMFDKITVDISNLSVGQHLSVSDLKGSLPPSARFTEDPHRVVVVIEAPRAAVAEAEAAVGIVPERVIAEAAEPEVIRRGKAGKDETE